MSEMNRIYKIRTVVFGIVAMLSLFETAFGTATMAEFLPDGFAKLEPEGTVTIDGADFTFFFNMMALGLNGFIMAVSALISIFSNLIMILLFRLIAYRKKNPVIRQELNLNKKILIYETGISILIQLFGYQFHYWYITVICNLLSAGFLYLVCIATVKTADAELQKTENYENCYTGTDYQEQQEITDYHTLYRKDD